MEDTKQNMASTEVAEYIAEMAAGLRQIAMQADMDFLAYLLDMAYQEAFDKNSGSTGGREG